MKRLLTTLVILTGLIGSGGAVWSENDNQEPMDLTFFDKAGVLNLLRKAAEQGHARMQNALGWMYRNGEGVTQDYAEAVKWFRKAAEQHIMTSAAYPFWSGIPRCGAWV